MSVSSGRFKLFSALKTLRLHWEQTKPQWHDPVRQDFEERFWDLLEPDTLGALAAMDTLAQVLLQARQECSREFLHD